MTVIVDPSDKDETPAAHLASAPKDIPPLNVINPDKVSAVSDRANWLESMLSSVAAFPPSADVI